MGAEVMDYPASAEADEAHEFVLRPEMSLNALGFAGKDQAAPKPKGRTLRRLRGMGARRWFGLAVVAPTILSALYFGLIASDQYVSQSRFVIKAPGARAAQSSTLANLIQTGGASAGREQADEVLDYIKSRDALADLDLRVGVKARYQARGGDWLSRYPAPWRQDRFENLYRYYRTMVEAHVDAESGVAVLTTKAFTPEDAQAINARLLDSSEALVNRLNARAEARAVAEASKRVAEAEARVTTARLALGAYRNSEAMLDPGKQATGVIEVSSRLEMEKAALQAQVQLMQRVAPANPALPALTSRLAAMGGAIAAQNGRAMGTGHGIAAKLGGYEKLAQEQEFAAQALTAANAAREAARTEAARQQFYLERVVNPDKPDMALYPERLRQVLVTAAAALCLYLIGWMLVVGILQHAPEE